MKRRAIEAEYGAPIGDVLRSFADQGYEQRAAAQILGASPGRIRVWCREAGFRWPPPACRKDALRLGVHQSARYVIYKGERMTLADIARREGLNYCTVMKRYQNGMRGDALGLPTRHDGRPREIYDLGISMTEWEQLVALANEKGAPAVRSMFGIPEGAIRAAQRGEWHRLA